VVAGFIGVDTTASGRRIRHGRVFR
jgi:hypothetical protein